MSRRQEQLAEIVKQHASVFVGQETNTMSLITFTRATISNDLKRETLYVSILPLSKENEAIDFLNRKKTDLRNYLKSHMKKARIIPYVTLDRKSTRLNSSHTDISRMPSSA